MGGGNDYSRDARLSAQTSLGLLFHRCAQGGIHCMKPETCRRLRHDENGRTSLGLSALAELQHRSGQLVANRELAGELVFGHRIIGHGRVEP